MSARIDAQASIRDGIAALSGSVRICRTPKRAHHPILDATNPEGFT
jgi:hypothetical protein